MEGAAIKQASNLSEEQWAVCKRSVSDRILVTAGPGTGKTHTLIARIVSLIEDQELSGGRDILVLSFSRAAVHEIKARCRKKGGNLSYIFASTFDSYATHILAREEPGGKWETSGYDGRIEAATKLLKENESARERHLGFRQLMIDEVQDLVGVRAEFIMTILEHLQDSVGVSLFGDPAQGIYDFQLDESERENGSEEVYAALRNDLEEINLTENFRSTSPRVRVADKIGPSLRERKENGDDLRNRVIQVHSRLPTLGRYEELHACLRESKRKTAILCTTNGESLMVSRKLWENSINHTLQKSATDRHLPIWLAILLSRVEGQTISISEFEEFANEANLDSISEKWNLLKRIVSARGSKIQISRLNNVFRTGYFPDELNNVIDSKIIVSTIHRSKGLEFEDVIIPYQTEGRAFDLQFPAEEARVLYVALTRAKRHLYRAEFPKLQGLKKSKYSDRWFRGYENWDTRDFEIKPADSDKLLPPYSVLTGGPKPREIQQYIENHVKPGDPVRLVLCPPEQGPETVYHILHGPEDFVVGITSTVFSRDLYGLVHSRWNNASLPCSIEELRVDGVQSVFGDPQVAKNDGLSASGCWLSVRIVGLGRLVHPKK